MNFRNWFTKVIKIFLYGSRRTGVSLRFKY